MRPASLGDARIAILSAGRRRELPGSTAEPAALLWEETRQRDHKIRAALAGSGALSCDSPWLDSSADGRYVASFSFLVDGLPPWSQVKLALLRDPLFENLAFYSNEIDELLASLPSGLQRSRILHGERPAT